MCLPSRSSDLRLALNQTLESLSEVHRCHPEVLPLGVLGVSGKEVEQLDEVALEALIAGEDPDVCVQTRRGEVVVTRTHVGIRLDL